MNTGGERLQGSSWRIIKFTSGSLERFIDHDTRQLRRIPGSVNSYGRYARFDDCVLRVWRFPSTGMKSEVAEQGAAPAESSKAQLALGTNRPI